MNPIQLYSAHVFTQFFQIISNLIKVIFVQFALISRRCRFGWVEPCRRATSETVDLHFHAWNLRYANVGNCLASRSDAEIDNAIGQLLPGRHRPFFTPFDEPRLGRQISKWYWFHYVRYSAATSSTVLLRNGCSVLLRKVFRRASGIVGFLARDSNRERDSNK